MRTHDHDDDDDAEEDKDKDEEDNDDDYYPRLLWWWWWQLVIGTNMASISAALQWHPLMVWADYRDTASRIAFNGCRPMVSKFAHKPSYQEVLCFSL